MKNEQYRQGDVLLVAVKQLPQGLKKKDNILARGETTGHAHVMDDGAVVYTDGNGQQYVQVQNEKSILKHEEHNKIDVPKGTYKVVKQQEYTPRGMREVRD